MLRNSSRQGAQIDTQNREGMTALAFAMDRKHSEIYQYLIERGASQETAMSILVKQLLYVKKMYPPKVQEITKDRQIGSDLGDFDPSHCKNPQDPYIYFAENRLVIKEKLPVNYIEKIFKEKYELAPLPKPLDSNAPAGCYENPMQKLNMDAYYFPLNIFYANDSVISLSKAERDEHCQYLPFSTLYCGPAKYYRRAYRVDRAIYSLPLNQPFVIYCENRGFSLGNLCTVSYKKGHHRIAYAVNPYDKNYSLTKALSIKEIIDKDKEKQYQLEANRITNYPWQD